MEKCETTRRYLDAWHQKDLACIEALLHPVVTFTGPLSATVGREAFLGAVKRMVPLLEGITVRHVMSHEDHAVAVYDFICVEPIGRCRTTELLGFQGDLIVSSELFFDARPFAAMRARQSG